MSSKLSDLLEAEVEPSQTSYTEAIKATFNDPKQISVPEDALKLYLTTRSHRFIRFFNLLSSSLPPDSTITSAVATGTIELITRNLPDLHLLLGPSKLVQPLIPALRVSLAPSQPLQLRKLGTVLSGCSNLLEHLATAPSGSTVVSRWVCLPTNLALDHRTLTDWTERFAVMVSSCRGDHRIASTIQWWKDLSALRKALEKLESRMRKLEDTKTATSKGHNPSVTLADDFKDLLQIFGLSVPGSRRIVQSHLDALSNSLTLPILRAIVASFPCKMCISCLGASPQSINANKPDDDVQHVSDLQLDLLGKPVGIWKVLLSAPALKSIQSLSSLGLFGPVQEKLTDIASGYLPSKLAGYRKQRDRLKVPVNSTPCGRDISMLWQLYVGSSEDLQQFQQVIIIWEVGDPDETSKALERVVIVQQAYGEELVHRCRQRSPLAGSRRFPLRFDNYQARVSGPESSFRELDVRQVDPKTIELANKFYALTEPMIRSILTNDLAAEFPFDLSKDEARCVSQFNTASLILGRSGTGKTTCLVFKLIGKFLASKAVPGENCARQVLLTRSEFLAAKLKTYTRRLIKTLESKDSSLSKAFQWEERKSEEDHPKNSVIALSDSSFPLICTFDQFLALLENTVIALDRQNFYETQAITSSSHDQVSSRRRPPQLVDFYTFQVEYWQRLPQTLTRSFSSHLVFSEIMGVIKGSESSRKSLTPLSREDYLKRSSRLAPTFASEDERSRVYNLFERYEDLKHRFGDFDYVDRVVKLLEIVRQEPSLMQILRTSFDEVYIDEVQDHRCLDLELLLSIIRDGRGFHFAGDTAQAISQDATFRFADAKKMLFEHFTSTSISTAQDQLGHAEMFMLSKNYRSHQGILALASMVMGLIWKGFPETVDKLEPDIGDLSGPKPVLLTGCDHTILLSSNVGSKELSERSSDFGAEQVILARDSNMKQKLQDQIGDIALIFTILESKGMEFDDVILWDFFTACPDQAGVRSLSTLESSPGTYDAKKYSSMCSELKHLYVAVTRARIQLFIVETSEDIAASIQKMLALGTHGPLVDITSPSHEDFAVRVEMMRPSTTVDRMGWARRADDLMHRRMFKEAIMPFLRAEDRGGEIKARAFSDEEEGRRCEGKGDIEGSTRNFEAAHIHFMKVNLFADAVRVLERMGRLEQAAELWLTHNQLARAASLFMQAGLYMKAVECHQSTGAHAEAIAILRDQKQYDSLVAYIVEHWEEVPTTSLRGYSLFCKLLLKQKKLHADSLDHALQLIGSPKEQEECFLLYGMNERLAALYKNQGMLVDLYRLYTRTGQLEIALSLALEKDLLHLEAGLSESEVLKLLDYVWAGHLIAGTVETLKAHLRRSWKHLSKTLSLRVQQWEQMQIAYVSSKPKFEFGYGGTVVEYTPAKIFLGLHSIFNHRNLARISTFDALPLDMMRGITQFAKDLIIKDTPQAQAIVLLVTGSWRFHDSPEQRIWLPWSPILQNDNNITKTDFLRVSKQWILQTISSAVLALESRISELWSVKWPERCVRFLVWGSCPDRARGKCRQRHRDVVTTDCKAILKDLLQVNVIFCDLGTIYYRRVLSQVFQEKYLGIRRRWLERFLRETTFLSPVEQSTSAITEIQGDVFRGDGYMAVRYSLEELLYFRLRNDWKNRSTFTALLEQMQLAQALGSNVRMRVFQSLSYGLHHDKRHLEQRHLASVNSLEFGTALGSAAILNSKVTAFLKDLDNVKVEAMTTLHALTAVFEHLAFSLILKTHEQASLIPKSWVDCFLPQVRMTIQLAKPSLMLQDKRQKETYQQCLLSLATKFCHVLHRSKALPTSENRFLCNGRPIDVLQLKQRNLQLLVIIIANLAAAPSLPEGFGQCWSTVRKALEGDHIGKEYSQSGSPAELSQKLSTAISKYKGREGLLLVSRNHRAVSGAFASLVQRSNIETVPFDFLCPSLPAPVLTQSSDGSHVPDPTEILPEESTAARTEQIKSLQRRWRSRLRIIKSRRDFLQLPKGRAIARFMALGIQCPDSISTLSRVRIRKALLMEGVPVSLRSLNADDELRRIKQNVSICIEHIDISKEIDESIENGMCHIREAETFLTAAVKKMGDSTLEGLVKRGEPPDVEGALAEVGDILTKAEEAMMLAKKVVGGMSKYLA